MKHGNPEANEQGGYWWFKPASTIATEPQALFVRFMRGDVRAVYAGALVRVSKMEGEWCGPIPLPEKWCELQDCQDATEVTSSP